MNVPHLHCLHTDRTAATGEGLYCCGCDQVLVLQTILPMTRELAEDLTYPVR